MSTVMVYKLNEEQLDRLWGEYDRSGIVFGYIKFLKSVYGVEYMVGGYVCGTPESITWLILNL